MRVIQSLGFQGFIASGRRSGHRPGTAPRRRPCAVACAAALLGLSSLPLHAVQITATYTGASGGQYGTAANWDVGQVPLNAGVNTYYAQIGPNKVVNYQVTTPRVVDQLLLDVGSSLNLTSSSLIQPTSLTVLGNALIAGSVNANQATFNALGGGTALLGNSITASAINGAVVRIAAPAFSARDLSNRNVMNAAGSGSVLDLSSVQTFNSAFNGGNVGSTNSVTSSEQANVYLTGTRTIIAPASSVYNLAFSASSGASIDLSSVQQISGLILDSGNTFFGADRGTLSLGPLVVANRVSVNLQNQSTMTVGGAAATAAITNSTFSVLSGSRLSGASLVGTYAARGLSGSNLLNASGTSTVLDLSGLQTIDSAFNSGNVGATNSVTASDNARLNLSGVRTVVAPANSVYNLSFSAISGATLDLSSIQRISGLTLETGNTGFSADAATLTLGPLQVANRVSVNLRNGATMTVGGWSGNAAITNSTFAVSSGAKLNGSTLVGTYSAEGLSGTTFMSATGNATVLDLSGLRTLEAAFNNGNVGATATVSVSNNAVVNLAGVTAITAPANAAYNLAFTATSGGRLDLSSLQAIAGATLDTGNTSFTGDAATFALGPLQSANRVSVGLQNGASLSVGGFSGNANISNSTFSVTSGARVNGATLRGDYSVRGLSGATFLRAAGAGSVLDLSGLQSINSAFNAGNVGATNSVTASDLALIKLGGVNTVVAPANSAYILAFNSGTGARIELGGLQTVNTASGGQVAFNVSSGGGISLRGFAAGNNVRFNAVDAGSNFSVNGSLSLLTGSSMFAGAGTRVTVSGDYSFQQAVESAMNLDAATLVFNGSGLQTLELGGARIVTLTNGAAVNGNFGIGQLDVGQDGSATTVVLQDWINNGNRSGGLGESLYLNGVAGGNGLRIFAGSVLALNGLDLYTTENGSWFRMNDRFTAGVTQIAYDQGFITLGVVPEPQTWALFGLGLAALGVRRLRQAARST